MLQTGFNDEIEAVSTHSHPKVAAKGLHIICKAVTAGFNTQPPEGGCAFELQTTCNINGFNTQPPEGGCAKEKADFFACSSFNTQPPEGGCYSDPAHPVYF